MKHLFIILIAVICFSCNSDDDGARNTTFHTPTWIQGTWYVQGSTNLSGVKFTTDDFCEIESGTETCYKNIADQSNGYIFVDEDIISDTEYEFELEYEGEPGVEREVEFHFRKISETQMVSIEDGIERVTYTKQ
ncbi:hypothetical protein BN863_30500 [Formosa agariphila KMM 3901]|uniref:Uncharacterized protein n=1 Tax=Formosa agariphila (strain DSM 15362 / KCTC 12365 / LMG 23005 / KMM 3901 / M-2Alg 35-1) TaxID=1347342 RepID=T2KPK1_FORAG|nr:hypothetical protein [Formosa agariphila]CDF80762.1 hypothetical protein BN863_30500 [Formosa agariphila KMM 3901]